MKSRMLLFTLIISIGLHCVGFILFRVATLEAVETEKYVEVGLFESRWTEPLIDLPGESADEKEFFEVPDPLFSRVSIQKKLIYDTNVADVEMPAPKVLGPPKYALSQAKGVNSGHEVDLREERVIGERRLIEGPLAKREIVFQKYPQYPAWAQAYGLEFEIRVKFWVLPSGEVSLVVVEDSSGYSEVDAEVVRVMKRWKFSSLEENNLEVEWGSILFKFRLKND